MKVQITQALRFKKQDTSIELKAGDVVTLPDSRALQLIRGGKAKPVIPEQCIGCWALDGATCYAKIKGRPCAEVIAECEYQTEEYRHGRRLPDGALTPQGTIEKSPGQFIGPIPEKAPRLVEMDRTGLLDGLEEYRNPKKQYNVLLRQARLIEQAFNKKQLTLDEREKRIEVYRAIIEVLDELLQEIRQKEPVSHEEAVRGFKLLH